MPISVDLRTGELLGEQIELLMRTVSDMKGSYREEEARQNLPQDTVVYRVQSLHPVAEGNEGGLFWGTTFIQPGLVGDEYFMTKGHHHAKRSRNEFYLAISGAGALILMDEKRQTRFEAMATGSLHYVPSHTAHRIANTGDCVLTVLACWPSDAGHDYESIASRLQRKPASGGRRSCARGRAMKALAVDLGGSHATCALVEDNCVVASRTVSAERMSQITASHFGEDTEVPVHGTVQRRSGRRGVQLLRAGGSKTTRAWARLMKAWQHFTPCRTELRIHSDSL